MFNNAFVNKAVAFATEKHNGQIRKASMLPYITHPLSVGELVCKFKQSKKIDELVAAAILHDTLEDTNTSFVDLVNTFSPLVASLVLELTSDKTEINKIGKVNYFCKKMTSMSSYALTIKLCDRLHNLTDNPTQKTIDESKEILSFILKHRIINKTQHAIISEITRVLNK